MNYFGELSFYFGEEKNEASSLNWYGRRPNKQRSRGWMTFIPHFHILFRSLLSLSSSVFFQLMLFLRSYLYSRFRRPVPQFLLPLSPNPHFLATLLCLSLCFLHSIHGGRYWYDHNLHRFSLLLFLFFSFFFQGSVTAV